MSGILRLESLTKGNTLKQGDKTPLKYRLFDADGEKLNIAGKSAQVRLVYPDFLTIGYEKDGLTVAQDDTVTFTIDGVIPSRIYHVEIIVDDKFIFPSRADESKFTVDKSSLGTEANIIEIVGVDAVVRKAVDLINEDPSLIIDEDKLVTDIISNTGIGNINEYYKAFNDLKPKAEQSISRSLEALSKSQNALNVANGIDAKATNALSLSELADTLSKSVQEQFNQIVINGDSSVEAAQARVDASGQTNPTLKARLDKEHNEVTTQLAQNTQLNNQGGSFVEKTKNLMNVKGMYARKISADSFGIGIGLNDFLNTVIEYKFDRNTDGLFLLRGVFTGEQSAPVYSYPLITLNGSFVVASSGGSTYTRTPEDSFIFEFTGTKLEFGYRAENRGGVWEFELSKPPINQVARLSTYATTPSYPTTTIFENLPYDTYQVKATFKGDDPINPPSSSPSRGYLNYNPNDLETYWSVRSMKQMKVNLINDSTKRELVSKDSIPDFAIRAKAKGATYDNVWVPKHSTVGGVSTSVTHKIVLDGTIYAIDNVPTDGIEIKHFFLTHRFNAENPNGGGTMWVHYLTHTITEKSPFVEINNRIEVSQDLEIQNMYFGMLPVNNLMVSRLTLNNGFEYNKPFPTSSQFLNANVSSFMYAGSYEAGRGHAAAIDNISYSEAVGLNERNDYSDSSNLSFTDAGINKAYFSVMRNSEVKTGDVFSNTHRIIVIGGLHFPNELLKQM